LAHETFAAWWYYAILPEDCDEFVKLHRGTMDGARMVCALDYLTNVDRRDLSPGVVIRAYLLALEMPESRLTDAAVRYSAQNLYDEPSVQTLYARLRSREATVGEEMVRRLFVGKLQKTYEKADLSAAEMAAMFTGSAALINAGHKREALQQTRRDKAAIRNAAIKNDDNMVNVTRLPRLEEVRANLLMLKAEYGDQWFTDLLASLQPALPPAP